MKVAGTACLPTKIKMVTQYVFVCVLEDYLCFGGRSPMK